MADPVRDASTTRQAATLSWRRQATPSPIPIRQTVADLFESWRRVARKTRVPTREGVLAFFGNQVLVNAVAWTAGVAAAGLVKRFFEVKGFRNLWGLLASNRRSLVSADDYQMIMTLASYAAGLTMLILIRHLLMRSIAEFRSLRLERLGGGRAPAAGPAVPGSSGPPKAPDPERSDSSTAVGRGSPGCPVSTRSRTRVGGMELFLDDPADD